MGFRVMTTESFPDNGMLRRKGGDVIVPIVKLSPATRKASETFQYGMVRISDRKQRFADVGKENKVFIA